MTTAERALDSGTRRANRIRVELGSDIRHGRVEYGLSQAFVARAVGISKSQLSRIERAENRGVSVVVLARVLAVLGMELGARAFPGGQPIRDKAHRALLDRLRQAIPRTFSWTYERPLPENRDQRAWDAAVAVPGLLLVVDAETRLSDLQSVERRVRLKLRDDPAADGCILAIADTRHNRAVLRAHPDALAGFARITPTGIFGIETAGNRLMVL